MKIFISWSGEKSMAVAAVLRSWLPTVIQSLEQPFVSDTDIESGANWSATIGAELSDATFGIVCVTKENQNRTWLNFEAGAISKLAGGAVSGGDAAFHSRVLDLLEPGHSEFK